MSNLPIWGSGINCLSGQSNNDRKEKELLYRTEDVEIWWYCLWSLFVFYAPWRLSYLNYSVHHRDDADRRYINMIEGEKRSHQNQGQNPIVPNKTDLNKSPVKISLQTSQNSRKGKRHNKRRYNEEINNKDISLSLSLSLSFFLSFFVYVCRCLCMWFASIPLLLFFIVSILSFLLSQILYFIFLF